MHGELCHQMIPSYNLEISKYSKSLRRGISWLSSGENVGLSLLRPGLSLVRVVRSCKLHGEPNNFF